MNIEGLGPAVGSALAGEMPTDVIEGILTFISSIEDSSIISNSLRDVHMIVRQFEEMDVIRSASSWIFSIFVADGSVPLKYGIHSGEDGPSIWALIKKRLYEDKMVVSKKKMEPVVEEERELTYEDMIDALDEMSFASEMEDEEEGDEEGLDKEEALMLGIGGREMEGEAVVEEEEEEFFTMMTPRAISGVFIPRSKYFTKESRVDTIPASIVNPFIMMAVSACEMSSMVVSEKLNCSACLITANDIIESDTYRDINLMGVVSSRMTDFYTVLNVSPYSKEVTRSRFNISKKKKVNMDLYIPMGLGWEIGVELTSEEARKRTAKVRKRSVSEWKKKGNGVQFPKMSYIGALGKVEI